MQAFATPGTLEPLALYLALALLAARTLKRAHSARGSMRDLHRGNRRVLAVTLRNVAEVSA